MRAIFLRSGFRGRRFGSVLFGAAIGGSLAFVPALLADCGGSSFTSSNGGTGGTSQSGAGGSGAQAGSDNGGGGQSTSGGSSNGGRGGSNNGGHGGKGHAGSAQGGSSGGGAAAGGSGGSSGSAGSAAGGAGGGGAVITRCPVDPPSTMSACQNGLVCTYGDDIRLSCRSRYTCVNGNFMPAVAGCKPLNTCLDRDGGIPMLGSICADKGEECLLQDPPNYIYCRCDGTWNCSPTPAQTAPACPQVAPNIGQACESGGTTCTYGSCSFPPAYDPTLQCKSKVWQDVGTVCATTGGG